MRNCRAENVAELLQVIAQSSVRQQAQARQTLMTLGSLACTTLTLQLGAGNLADALKLKQRLQAKGLDTLNSCWSSDSSWQLLVLEDSGMA